MSFCYTRTYYVQMYECMYYYILSYTTIQYVPAYTI